MIPDFCAFILTHGRPDRVITYDTLLKAGYSGPIYLIVDDEDKTLPEYRARFGDKVLTFSKAEVAKTTDDGDNQPGYRGVIYARNVCFDLAKRLGYTYFIQLDDDYTSFYLRFNQRLEYGNTPMVRKSIDNIFDALLEFLKTTPTTTIALSQGGDHIGGDSGKKQAPRLKRKAMNSFICSTERPFKFVGRVNEDTNAYTTLGRKGHLFFTVMQAQLNQLQTQANPGGMTDLYLDNGTFVKSFYTVLYEPSCAQVSELGDPRNPRYRLHHFINWRHTVPVILRQKYRKSQC